MKFENYTLSSSIKKNLAKMGFVRPTDIQFKCIAPIQKGEDLLAIAQTGTGKTAAFAIPILDKVQLTKRKKRSRGIRCIVMVPTRELSLQIGEVLKKLSKNTGINILSLYGGKEQDSQIEKLQKGVDVLICTPGRLFDLRSQGFVNLEYIETLVIDEADHMLDLGFYDDIKHLLRYLPKKRQTLFFSATIDDKIKKLAYSLTKNAIRIQVSPKDPVSKNVTHSVAFIEMDDKRFFLKELIEQHESFKFLVFVRTKVRAERVKKALHKMGIESETLHGDIEQHQRESVLQNFKGNNIKVLIATDVSARGIDIPNIDYVVNYDLPENPENYVHRVGRTGRGKNKGLALAFCSSGEKELLEKIENYTNVPIQVTKINKTSYKEVLKLNTEEKDDWKQLLLNEQQDLKKKRKKKK